MKKKIDKLITVIDRTFFFQKFVCAFFNGIESFCFLWKEVELRQQKYGNIVNWIKFRKTFERRWDACSIFQQLFES